MRAPNSPQHLPAGSVTRRARFEPYRPRTILNQSKRADHWFWSRYSAYPYVGCQHGCEFCYCREEKYCPHDDCADFPYVIKVKQNAPDLLRRALGRVPVDVVFTGDYQPAERRFQLTRRMLEVCLELGFPVLVLERSPLVLRDLDLIEAIRDRAAATVAFSLIAAPGSPHYDRVRRIERLAPAPERRLAAMETLARAGVVTGTVLMPVLPELTDDPITLRDVVRRTADHGGRFVLAGGLTLADQQRDHFLGFLDRCFPDLAARYRALYPPGSYGPSPERWRRTALAVRELCTRHGLSDRMPRPIIPGEKLALNKRVVEQLAHRLYQMELDRAPDHRLWAIRKATWAIQDLDQDLRLIHQVMSRKGIESIQHVGPALASDIERLIHSLTDSPTR